MEKNGVTSASNNASFHGPIIPLSAADWEPYQPAIKNLYWEKDLSLAETIETMRSQHNFSATYVFPLLAGALIAISHYVPP